MLVLSNNRTSFGTARTNDPRFVYSGTNMSTVSLTISDALQRQLESQRDALNALFRSRVKRGAKIDPHIFFDHLRTRIGSIIAAIELVLPERTRLATTELYEVSLELFAAGHFGVETRTPRLLLLWESLFPRIARQLAREPRRVAGCLSNAMVQIEQQSSSIAERWIRLVAQSSQYTESVDELLVLGKVAAWVSGMAHYRRSALSAAALIPAKALAALFGLSPDTDENILRNYLSQLAESPWCNFTNGQQTKKIGARQVALCGAFRGFGGALMKPPTVVAIEDKLMISDGQNVWQIFADRFGSVTQRIDAEPFQGPRSNAQSNPRVGADGTIRWDGSTFARSDLANATSFAFDGTTLAVTIPTSFHVFLFAQASADDQLPQADMGP